MDPAVTPSIALRAALLSGLVPLNVPVFFTVTLSTMAETVSEPSPSTTVSVPVVETTASVSLTPAVAPSPLPTVMSGASLLPVIVTDTV